MEAGGMARSGRRWCLSFLRHHGQFARRRTLHEQHLWSPGPSALASLPALRPFEKGSTMGDFGITAHGPRMFFLSGELDTATVPIMNVAIADAVSRGGPITIDMADLTFMDSSGVGAIIGSAKTLPTGCIVLHGAHDGVGKVLDLMGVDRAIPNLHVIPCSEGGDPAKVA
jgi:anti-sigma B factor antagonist